MQSNFNACSHGVGNSGLGGASSWGEHVFNTFSHAKHVVRPAAPERVGAPPGWVREARHGGPVAAAPTTSAPDTSDGARVGNRRSKRKPATKPIAKPIAKPSAKQPTAGKTHASY